MSILFVLYSSLIKSGKRSKDEIVWKEEKQSLEVDNFMEIILKNYYLQSCIFWVFCNLGVSTCKSISQDILPKYMAVTKNLRERKDTERENVSERGKRVMKKELSTFELQLCDIQGRLFELALKNNIQYPDFAEKYMNSETAKFMDYPYDRMQWAGEEYILENLMDEVNLENCPGENYDREEVYWMGYVYRYWHFYTGENSKQIYAQADAPLMRSCYLGFHTMDVAMAVEDLKEIYKQKQEIKSS